VAEGREAAVWIVVSCVGEVDVESRCERSSGLTITGGWMCIATILDRASCTVCSCLPLDGSLGSSLSDTSLSGGFRRGEGRYGSARPVKDV
jgi:hypothetical protein